MRKLIVLGVLVTAGFGLAPAAWAGPSIPTCLIANGGGGGHFTKSVICVELVNLVSGRAGSGSYSSGDDASHWLAETVEFRVSGHAWVPWRPLPRVVPGRCAPPPEWCGCPSPARCGPAPGGTDTSTNVRELCSTAN